MSIYLSGAKPRILAHRGLSRTPTGEAIDENTIPAFVAAIAAGATHIESDIQVTSDGIAVLFHDNDLSRVAGRQFLISSLTLEQLNQLKLEHGGSVPTLQETLKALPEARFNLDFKTQAAIASATKVISQCQAQNRVLIASFSDGRRAAAQALLPQAVGSAGGARAFGLFLCLALGLQPLARLLAKPVVALQLPLGAGPVRFDRAWFIASVHSVGLEVHFWTINEPAEMQRLIGFGADGIVTDRADLAVAALLS